MTVPEATKPNCDGERFRMLEPKEPYLSPPGSENWPVRDLVSPERFRMLEPKEPNPRPDAELAGLDALPEPEQAAVRLCVVEARPIADAARTMGVSLATVAGLLNSALTRLHV